MDHAYSPEEQGPSAATWTHPPTSGPLVSQTHDPQCRMQTHVFNGGFDISHQPTLTGKFPLSPTQQLQFHTPAQQHTNTGLGAQLSPSPPMLSPYIGPGVAPAQVPTLPSPVVPSATPSVPQTTVKINMSPTHLFQSQGAQ